MPGSHLYFFGLMVATLAAAADSVNPRYTVVVGPEEAPANKSSNPITSFASVPLSATVKATGPLANAFTALPFQFGAGAGDMVNNFDDGVTLINIPLGYPVFGVISNAIQFSTNGFLELPGPGGPILGAACCTGQPGPSPFQTVAGFWTDLVDYAPNGGYIRISDNQAPVSPQATADLATAVTQIQSCTFNNPDFVAVATWDHVPAYNGGPTRGSYTFQIIIAYQSNIGTTVACIYYLSDGLVDGTSGRNTPTTAGVTAGSTGNFVNLFNPGENNPQTLADGTNIGTPGKYCFRIDGADIVPLVPVACGGGDPWFTSFDGVRYPFHGVPGQIFSIISEEHHQINALFAAETNPRNSAVHGLSTGTWLSEIGFQYGGTLLVKINVAAFQKLTVTVNSTPLALGSREVSPDGCSVNYQSKSNDLVAASSEVVTVATPFMKFTVWAPKALTTDDPTETQETPSLDFNVAITSAADIGEMHGVVGQTWQYVAGDKNGNPVTHPEGNDWLALELLDETAHYQVSELFATDSHYNKYKADSKPSTSRRKLSHAEPTVLYQAGTKLL